MYHSILVCAALLGPGPTNSLRELLNAKKLTHSQIIGRCASIITVRYSHAKNLADPQVLDDVLKGATPGFPIRSTNNYRCGYIEETQIKSSVLRQKEWRSLLEDIAYVEDVWPYVNYPDVAGQKRGYVNVIRRKMASNMRLILYLKTYKDKEYIAEVEYDSL